MMIFIFVQNIIQMFFKGSTTSNPVAPVSGNSSMMIGTRFISESQIQNFLKPGDPFDFDVYINYQSPAQFFYNGGIVGKEPEWSERALKYDYSPENERHSNLTLPVT